jgi:7,8-dihydroneopterin aldolase/epimerase/oxygenase
MTMAMDTIVIRGLEVMAFCGVLPEETERRQPFGIDLEVYLDLAAAGANDDLNATVHYGELCMAIDDVVATQRFGLLERFAQVIAEVALGFDLVEGVTVEVHKLRPPVPLHLASSGVRITRHRP